MPIENMHTIKGTLFSKECRKVPNKKKPQEPDWEFLSIKVETKIQMGGSLRTMIPELHLDRNVTYDEFEVGDQIEVDFYLTGKQVNPTWHKTEARVCYIKHQDIQTAKSYDNKIPVSAMSDINTIGEPPKEKDDVFTGATQIRPLDKDKKEEEDDLPFVLTILMTIGFLTQFLI